MRHQFVRGIGGRLTMAALLALALSALPVPPTSLRDAVLLQIGAGAVQAQGGMDYEILTPSFSELPDAVLPGETFTIRATTARGAHCSGQVAFRDHPPIALEALKASDGVCSWSVTVPQTVRASTGIISIDLARNRQGWFLFGVVYVRPVAAAG